MSRRSVWSLNSANSQALADFVDARGATGATWASGAWDEAASADYVLVVTTRHAGMYGDDLAHFCPF